MPEPEQMPPEHNGRGQISGLAITSLVLGIIGVLFFMFPEAALVLSALAIIFGGVGLNQITNETRRGTGLAIAGLVLGIVGLVLAAYGFQQPAQPPSDRTEDERPADKPEQEEPAEPEPETPQAPESEEPPQQEPEQEAPQEKPPAQQPKQEAPKQWTTVLELSGGASKRSDIFELKGGKARLSYNVTGDELSIVSIYVIEEGKSLEDEGGFPEVMVEKPGNDTTFLAKNPGRYYLEVDSANAEWVIKIEEER